ncbi:MAG: HYR domain-containing protein [Flavobacteriales bacterium]|nr:HYR domain-containing protein [Flavobacteriales bacterium]
MKKFYHFLFLIFLVGTLHSFGQESNNVKINSSNYYSDLVNKAIPLLTKSAELTSGVLVTQEKALVFVDMAHSADGVVAGLNNLGYLTTIASNWIDFNTKLATGDYVIAVAFAQNRSAVSYGFDLSVASDFIDSGGKMIFATWTDTDISIANLFEANITANRNMTTVNITDPGVASGLANPFTLSNEGWGVFSLGLTPIGQGEILAKYENDDAAMIRGNGGKTIILGYLSDAPVVINDRQPIFENIVNNLFTPLEISLYEDGKYVLNNDDKEELAGKYAQGATSIYVNPASFNCNHVGEYNRVAVNITGENDITLYKYVAVSDTISPVALCKDIEITLDANNKASIYPAMINAGDGNIIPPAWARTYNGLTSGSYDACGIEGLDIDQYNFDCSNVGQNIVTLTAYDPSGNTSTCTSIVTVKDIIAPEIESMDDIEVTAEAGVCETEITYPAIVVTDNCNATLELVEGLGEDGLFPIGTTTETWKATDESGNTATVSFDVIVVATNALPTIDEVADVETDEDSEPITVELSGIGCGNDCEAQEVTVTAVSSNTGLVESVAVEYTEGDTTGTVELVLAPDMDGSSEITVTVEDSEGGVTTTTFTLTVNPVNDAPFLLTPVADQSVNASYVLKVPLSSVPGDMFGDIDDDVLVITAAIEGTDSLPVWATLAGDTLVCQPILADTSCVNIVVTATDTSGATATDTFEICVEGYPTAVTGLGANQFEVNMYPNPATGKVNLDFKSGTYNVELSVMDITGKTVMRKSYTASERITFDMSDKVAGMYFVKIDVDGIPVIKKLVVTK